MHAVEKVVRNIQGQEKVVEIVFGSGHLTSNPPELRTANDKPVLSGKGFSIKFTTGRDSKPTYYSVEAWGRIAENLQKLGFENQLLEVMGRKETRSYKKDGEDKEYTVLVIERFTCLEYKPKAPTGNGSTQSVQGSAPGTVEINDDDLPF